MDELESDLVPLREVLSVSEETLRHFWDEFDDPLQCLCLDTDSVGDGLSKTDEQLKCLDLVLLVVSGDKSRGDSGLSCDSAVSGLVNGEQGEAGADNCR